MLIIFSFVLFESLEVNAEESTYSKTGEIEFIPGDSVRPPIDPVDPDPDQPVDPWDPTSPDGKPAPGTQGPLSIDYASSFDFGTNEIDNKDRIYYANPQYYFDTQVGEINKKIFTPNYVQVSDMRGTNTGWRLTVKQLYQFRNDETKNSELIGAQVKLNDSEAISYIEQTDQTPLSGDVSIVPGESFVVMQANKGAGAQTWINRWSKVETIPSGEVKNTSVQLFIPGSTPKDAVTYKTEFIWTLSDSPAN
ncbi:WxL domain-containing protein [Vagococcus zengguangii]|uniref:WxL domain-containing protein n=2 Tax=Vagococcus zengguangii TaxID=2571750 RepID=A0A4D7CVD8_9ENTE|nr:WxL domain-containing protein [Vagococcus zengguangii]QCI87384.1 WxL domain-containing protein [Vagococcus zengguangii]TLG78279.1 WxL domain-containing protein [Vagococcus zengguangii]